MSYYTRFYPDKSKYLEKYDDPKVVSNKIEQDQRSIDKYRTYIKAAMVDAYYKERVEDAANSIYTYWWLLKDSLYEKETLDWILTVISSKEEKPYVEMNHAQCNSEYELKDSIESYDDMITDTFCRLLVLSRVKYSSEEGNVMEYLQYEYQNKIDEILDTITDCVLDKCKDEFMLENFSRKFNEDEEPGFSEGPEIPPTNKN